MDGMVESYVCVYIYINYKLHIHMLYILYIYTHLQSYYAEIPPFFWGGGSKSSQFVMWVPPPDFII